jgi:hypothetical protein
VDRTLKTCSRFGPLARRGARWALLVAAATLATAATASAHLIAPRSATLHVLGESVYSVVWLPASALTGVDADGDGLLSESEVARVRDRLTDALGRRFVLRDGDDRAATVRIDLVLQPLDDAPPDRAGRAAELVMLHHARFSRPPRQVELETDLFGPSTVEPELSVSATRDRAAERATLRPPEARHLFFAAERGADTSRPLRFALIGALAGVALSVALSIGAVAGHRRARR